MIKVSVKENDTNDSNDIINYLADKGYDRNSKNGFSDRPEPDDAYYVENNKIMFNYDRKIPIGYTVISLNKLIEYDNYKSIVVGYILKEEFIWNINVINMMNGFTIDSTKPIFDNITIAKIKFFDLYKYFNEITPKL